MELDEHKCSALRAAFLPTTELILRGCARKGQQIHEEKSAFANFQGG